jgi:hypothetical protein
VRKLRQYRSTSSLDLIGPIASSDAALVRLAVQLPAKIRMSYRYQGLGALVDAKAEKVDPAYHMVDIAAAGDHAGGAGLLQTWPPFPRSNRKGRIYLTCFALACNHPNHHWLGLQCELDLSGSCLSNIMTLIDGTD